MMRKPFLSRSSGPFRGFFLRGIFSRVSDSLGHEGALLKTSIPGILFSLYKALSDFSPSRLPPLDFRRWTRVSSSTRLSCGTIVVFFDGHYSYRFLSVFFLRCYPFHLYRASPSARDGAPVERGYILLTSTVRLLPSSSVVLFPFPAMFS